MITELTHKPDYFPAVVDLIDPPADVLLGVWWWFAADILMNPADVMENCWEGHDIAAFKRGAPIGWGHESPASSQTHLTTVAAEHYEQPVDLIPAFGGFELAGNSYNCPCYWITRSTR